MFWSYFLSHQSVVFGYLEQHIEITLITLVIASAIALPVGTAVARFSFLYVPVMAILGVIYTIPSLALLALLVPTFGIGQEPAIIALVAYAQFILVRNVVVGLRGVDASVLEAARGMGMNRAQLLLKIEYPLALPVMLGGLRIATVATIAIATVAAYIDAGGLGRLMFDGLNENNIPELVTGTVAVSILAIVADIILRLVDRMLPGARAKAV
ncbi:MAG: ABC transporter permease [Chloroflexota bacterium]